MPRAQKILKSQLREIEISDQARFDILMKASQCTTKDYLRYKKNAKKFLAEYKQLSFGFRDPDIKKIEFVESSLFKNEYLVVTVSMKWFLKHPQNLNAFAADKMDFQFGQRKLSSPPVVVLPEKSKLNKVEHKSVVEHEFVHVNQAITDKLPALNSKNPQTLLKLFFRYTEAEYAANFIQLYKWPQLLSKQKSKVSLHRFCALRGFTSALEEAIRRALVGTISLDILLSLLFGVENRIPKEFKTLFLESEIDFFKSNFRKFIQIAVTNNISQMTALEHRKIAEGILHWSILKS